MSDNCSVAGCHGKANARTRCCLELVCENHISDEKFYFNNCSSNDCYSGMICEKCFHFTGSRICEMCNMKFCADHSCVCK